MEFLKKHFTKILIGLLIVFSLNKCTVACNRSQTINKQQTEIVQKDSTIKAQEDSLNILKIRWNDAQTSQSTYQGIALDTKQSLANEVNELTIEKNQLTERVKQLTTEVNALKKENRELKQQLNNK